MKDLFQRILGLTFGWDRSNVESGARGSKHKTDGFEFRRGDKSRRQPLYSLDGFFGRLTIYAKRVG